VAKVERYIEDEVREHYLRLKEEFFCEYDKACISTSNN
jgi:hypothetical protein